MQSTSPFLLASIVESSDDAIISKDLNGVITSWNAAAAKIFGYTAEEMIGNSIRVLAPSDRKDEMQRILKRIAQGERLSHFETKRQAKSGRILDVSLTVSPIRNAEGEIIGASKIARDITEKKMAEEAILEQAQKLARSNADLQEFAYVTSHDLQEPLRTIAVFSELLQRRYAGQLDAEADRYIRFVTSAASRMSTLIRDVLDYSKVIREEELMQGVASAQDMVDRALENLQSRIRETGAVIDVGQLPNVNADRGAISQVFQNLISNALKYRKPRVTPCIRIESVETPEGWQFSVRDNGIGIAPAYHNSVFGLFKRLHSTTYPGTGIGLAFCKRIIEKHKGRIWVESDGESGSTFHFVLPKRTAVESES